MTDGFALYQQIQAKEQMRAKPMIFFDIDGTLVDHEEAEYRAAQAFQQEYRHYFSDSPEMFVQRWHTLTEEHMERYLARELSFQGQRRARLQTLFAPHQALSDREADDLFMCYLRHYENNWTLYPDVRECLHHLADYPLGIISNGDSVQQIKAGHGQISPVPVPRFPFPTPYVMPKRFCDKMTTQYMADVTVFILSLK